MQNEKTKKITLSAMFLALGIVLPFLTGQIQQIGSMLLPMHIPIILCGLICGWQYGAAVGFILPVFRFALFGMPPIFPLGISMSFELATYGLLIGILYVHARWQCIRMLYRCLIMAMIGGRIVWGLTMYALTGLSGSTFSMQMFISGAFLTAIPGIVLQLVLIPAIMLALDRTGMVPFRKNDAMKAVK